MHNVRVKAMMMMSCYYQDVVSKYGHCGEWYCGLKGGWAGVKIWPHCLLLLSLRREEGGGWQLGGLG